MATLLLVLWTLLLRTIDTLAPYNRHYSLHHGHFSPYHGYEEGSGHLSAYLASLRKYYGGLFL